VKIQLKVKKVKMLQSVLTKKKSTIGDFDEFEDSSGSSSSSAATCTVCNITTNEASKLGCSNIQSTEIFDLLSW